MAAYNGTLPPDEIYQHPMSALSLTLTNSWHSAANGTGTAKTILALSGDVDQSGYTTIDTLSDVDVLANCTPNSGYDYQDDRYMRHVVSIVVPVLFGVIVVLGLIGNATTIAIVLGRRSKQLRNSTNLLIVNLACADLLFIIFCVPFTASDYVVGVWPFGNVWCKVVQYLVHVCAYSSVYTLVLMSVDRYLAVVHPISSISLRTERNTYIALAIQWIIIMCNNIPLILAHGTSFRDLHDCEWRVPCIFQFDAFDEPSFRLSFLGTFFILPVTIISSLYFIMLRRLWHAQGPTGHRSSEANRSKKRVTRMVIAVVVIFVLCWSPITFILALKSLALYPINSISIPIQIAAHVLAYSNVCLNPFIYAAAHPGFRSSFKSLLCCGRLSPRSPNHPDFERTDIGAGESTTTSGGFLRGHSLRFSKNAYRAPKSRTLPNANHAEEVALSATLTVNDNPNYAPADPLLTNEQDLSCGNGFGLVRASSDGLSAVQIPHYRQHSIDSVF